MHTFVNRIIVFGIAFLVGLGAAGVWSVLSQTERLLATSVSRREEVQIAAPLFGRHGGAHNWRPLRRSDLRPSPGFWDKDSEPVRVQISRIDKNRRLAAAGDTLYMLDNENRLIWTWTTNGPPLSDFPIIDSRGSLYVIAFDLIFVSLDSESGIQRWSGTACGRALYSQIESYRNDMYFVVTDMSGYRDDFSSGVSSETKDMLTLFNGNQMLWNTEIPIGAKLRIRNGRVFIAFKRNGRSVVRELKPPTHFEGEVVTIDEFGFGSVK